MNRVKKAICRLRVGIRFSVKWLGLILAMIPLCTVGCSLVKLNKEVKESLASTTLVGQIATIPQARGMIVVSAYSLKEGKREIAHHAILHGAGEYELMVAEGNYYICAYWDLNSNLVYDAGEPAGQYGEPRLVAALAGGAVLEINFEIAAKGGKIDLPPDFEISPDKPRKLLSRQAGAIVTLEDERFSAENGSLGFWAGLEFFKEIGGNIYFLEEYDPGKIPILFIHGAAGTPRGWEYLIDKLDRKRFQPWLFYYPSGSRIKSMAYLLFWKLFNLQLKYKFDTLYITAHSMGGLVARSLIMDHYRFTPYIKLFISLATPWGGDRMAEYGVKQSPAVIPSWIDMQPEGEFIQSLYRDKMPAAVSFYMFTGYQGSRNPFTSNNDGTITLASILDWRPQTEAKMNYAFNEDHASILKSPAAMAQYNTIINSYAEGSAETATAGGYLEINFAFDYPLDGCRPRPILFLRRDDDKAPVTEIHLSPDDSGRRLGPLPAGDYMASLMGAAVKADRNSVPVSIAKDVTRVLSFTLRPAGMVYGDVVVRRSAEDRPAGMPAEQYLANDRPITIQKVTLKGPGVERVVRVEDRTLDSYEKFISSTDFCTPKYFHFFGLPAGDYEVRIIAEGFNPETRTYVVKPGRPAEVRAIELVPEELVTQ